MRPFFTLFLTPPQIKTVLRDENKSLYVALSPCFLCRIEWPFILYKVFIGPIYLLKIAGTNVQLHENIEKRKVCIFGTASQIKQKANEKTSFCIFNRKVSRSKLHSRTGPLGAVRRIDRLYKNELVFKASPMATDLLTSVQF